jgi:hypothetical protein
MDIGSTGVVVLLCLALVPRWMVPGVLAMLAAGLSAHLCPLIAWFARVHCRVATAGSRRQDRRDTDTLCVVHGARTTRERRHRSRVARLMRFQTVRATGARRAPATAGTEARLHASSYEAPAWKFEGFIGGRIE